MSGTGWPDDWPRSNPFLSDLTRAGVGAAWPPGQAGLRVTRPLALTAPPSPWAIGRRPLDDACFFEVSLGNNPALGGNSPRLPSEGGLVREGRKGKQFVTSVSRSCSPARIVKFEGKNDQTWSDWGSVALHGGAAFVERTSQGRQDGGGGGGALRIPGRLAGYLDHLGLITLADHSHWQPAGPALSTPTHPSFPHLARELTRPGFAQPFHGRPRAENEAMPSRPRKATVAVFTANSSPPEPGITVYIYAGC